MYTKIQEYLDLLQEEITLNNNFEVGDSSIHGKGVIATKYMEPGEFINVALVPMGMGGHKATCFGRYINHCDTPNAETKLEDNYYKTYCTENISPADEITVDYRRNQSLEQPKEGWR